MITSPGDEFVLWPLYVLLDLDKIDNPEATFMLASGSGSVSTARVGTSWEDADGAECPNLSNGFCNF